MQVRIAIRHLPPPLRCLFPMHRHSQYRVLHHPLHLLIRLRSPIKTYFCKECMYHLSKEILILRWHLQLLLHPHCHQAGLTMVITGVTAASTTRIRGMWQEMSEPLPERLSLQCCWSGPWLRVVQSVFDDKGEQNAKLGFYLLFPATKLDWLWL